jgi:hypothetical protein
MENKIQILQNGNKLLQTGDKNRVNYYKPVTILCQLLQFGNKAVTIWIFA